MGIPCQVTLIRNCVKNVSSLFGKRCSCWRPHLCKDILREIDKKPENETIFCSRLLDPSAPIFDGLILFHQHE